MTSVGIATTSARVSGTARQRLQSARRGGGFSGWPDLDPLVGLDDPSKPLCSRLTVPALRERYLEYADIARNRLNWDTLDVRVRRHQALIEADVMADGRKLYSNEAFDPAGLQGFVLARRATC